MYENYTKQSLPSKEYRELLGRRSMIICIHHVSLLEQMWRMQDLSKQRIHLPDYYRKVQWVI